MASFLVCLCCAAGPAAAQVEVKRDRLGDVLQLALPLGAAALAGYERDMPGLRQLGVSLLVSEGSTQALKHLVDSKRPDGSGQGFPSGHASRAFASAAFVHQRYGLAPAAGFYALATVTAYSRVHTHHHFTRDVLGGAAIGAGSAFLFTRPRDGSGTLSLAPLPGGVHIELTQRW